MARPAPEVEAGAEAGFLETLLEGIAAREARALGRAISLVKEGGPQAEELLRRLRGGTGRARLLGVTGPPGVGKSTLVESLARLEREAGRTVAILAIDPTSPFTGGALLGDRIRMQSLYTDPGVFIRSMATRGARGGLTAAVHDAVDVLDAAGFDRVILETVGVGQAEVDVVRAVDTVAVVVIPGMGDAIQAEKAGLLEIADVFVLNKADREGADRTVKDLQAMLQVAAEARGAEGTADRPRWSVPVVPTVAPRKSDRSTPERAATGVAAGNGIEELAAALDRHRRYLEESGDLARRRKERFALRVEEALKGRLLAEVGGRAGLRAKVESAAAEEADPYRLAKRLFRDIVDGAKNEEGAEG